VTLERLERERFVRLNVSPDGEPFLPFAHGNFRTPSGRCEFHAETIHYEPPVESRRGCGAAREVSAELVSPKNHDSMNSTFGNREDLDRDTSLATMHPADANAGDSNGDQIRIRNGLVKYPDGACG